MEPRYIDRGEDAKSLRSVLDGARVIALDAEAAGFHRYSDRLSLVQLTLPEEEATPKDLVLDPFAVDLAPVLGPALEGAATEVVMHGADFDLRLFHRDLGIRIHGLFDTQVAAALLGREALGLQALARDLLGVELSKEHQRADWAQRPLPAELLRYAAEDTRHLPDLAEALGDELRARERLSWAREEFEALQSVRFEPPEERDPVIRVKGARDLEPRALARLRAALRWRDEEARRRDRAPFRVAGDPALLQAAVDRPGSPAELAGIRGLSEKLVDRAGRDLLDRFDAVDALPEEELEPYPLPLDNGRPRPPKEVEARVKRLKEVRNETARTLGLARGVLLANWALEALAWARPRDREELEAVDGMRRWHLEVMGDDLLAAVKS